MLTTLVLMALIAALVAAPVGAQGVSPVAAGKYVSMGDSFASGEGIPPFENGTDVAGVNRCHRSPFAYPALIAGKPGMPARATSERWACSGATTTNIWFRGQGGEPAQFTHVDATTTLVTIGIGGNDIGYAPVIAYCLLHTSCHVDKGRQVQAATDRLGTILPKVFSNLLARAPLARILVVGYSRFFPRQPYRACSPGVGVLDTGEQRWGNAAVLRLDAELVKAVAAQHTRRIRFVNTYDAWDRRELCGGGGTLTNVNLAHIEYSLHPTLLGQRLIADKVLAAATAP